MKYVVEVCVSHLPGILPLTPEKINQSLKEYWGVGYEFSPVTDSANAILESIESVFGERVKEVSLTFVRKKEEK